MPGVQIDNPVVAISYCSQDLFWTSLDPQRGSLDCWSPLHSCGFGWHGTYHHHSGSLASLVDIFYFSESFFPIWFGWKTCGKHQELQDPRDPPFLCKRQLCPKLGQTFTRFSPHCAISLPPEQVSQRLDSFWSFNSLAVEFRLSDFSNE